MNIKGCCWRGKKCLFVEIMALLKVLSHGFMFFNLKEEY